MQRSVWWFFVALFLCAHATQARADSCFDLANDNARGTRDANARSSARKITLGARIKTKAGCEYALSPDATWVKLGALDSDFAGVIEALTTQTRAPISERPISIFARNATPSTATGVTGVQPAAIESVFLAGCSEYLLSEGHGFALRVPINTQRPTVTRERDVTSCGSQQVALYFLATTRASNAPLLKRGPFNATLPITEQEIALEPGAYAIYAARADDAVGYLLGRVDTGSSLTPLRDALLNAKRDASDKLLRAAWKHGRLQLEPITAALHSSEAWAELRTAATADALWLQRRDKRDASVSKLGKLAMSAEGDAIYLPVEHVSARMLERYGDAGRYMAPDLSEWANITSDIELCVADRYALPQSTVAASTQPQCMAINALMAPLSVHGGVDIGAGRVCIADQQHVMTAVGTQGGDALPELCASLQSASTAQIDSPPFLLVNKGSRLSFDGQGFEQLFACLDNDCQPLPGRGESLLIAQSGLLEVRHADSRDHARSAQALTRLRIGVIDPAREWHPVGLHTAKTVGVNAWQNMLHDADHVFTYARRQQHLDFRVSASATLVAAWNQRASETTQLTQQVPIFGGVTGTLEGTKPSALVAVITERSACPEQTAGELAAQPPINPERLLPGDQIYVHLAHYSGDGAPLRCLARARLRVVESRSLRVTDQIRVGLLGDVQLVVFITDPSAIGLSLPLVYGFWRWGYGFGLDASISLASAITFDPSQISRTGLMASTALVWGPERIAPRLLSFGVALHAATGTHDKEPFGSVYGALNLSSLIDLAGGR